MKTICFSQIYSFQTIHTHTHNRHVFILFSVFQIGFFSLHCWWLLMMIIIIEMMVFVQQQQQQQQCKQTKIINQNTHTFYIDRTLCDTNEMIVFFCCCCCLIKLNGFWPLYSFIHSFTQWIFRTSHLIIETEKNFF